MQNSLLKIFACVALLALGRSLHGQEFQPLFNGTDLKGWVLVNTPPRTWSVKDQMLLCTGKPIGELRTEEMVQNFELELEWRHMVPRGNAGVFIWADDITARGVPFHRGIEVQVLENAYGNTQSHTTHGDIFPIHGATMEPVNGRGGGSRAFPTEERSKPSPEWNHYRIVGNDGSISLAVNGKVVTQGKQCNPRKGYICLESEGGVVHYRNIKLKRLPDTPIDPQLVAVANRNFRSIYSGLDLAGWSTSDSGKSAWHANDWELKFDGSATGDAAQLTTSEALTAQGLVIDWKFIESSSSIKLAVPGIDEALTFQAQNDPKWSKALNPRGQWNRLELKLDATPALVLNGQSQSIIGQAKAGKLAITPSGQVDLANIYVR